MKERCSGVIKLIFLSLLFAAQTQAATVLWHNLSDGPGGTNAGVTQDVVDQNIDVIGTNALVNAIHVTAQTTDIFITVTNGDAVITGSGNRADGVPQTEPARLYLSAAINRTITFSLAQSLMFRGTADGANELDLLVSITGSGNVVFNIEGGQSVSFSSTPSTGGTYALLGMQTPSGDPKLIFKRMSAFSGNINADIDINIGPKSYLSYIAETPSASGSATQEGTIRFDPSNSGSGLTVVNIAPGAAFVIRGHYLPVPFSTNFLISDVQFGVAAGQLADLAIINSNGLAGFAAPLRIVNDNNLMPNLVSDPFHDNSFAIDPAEYGFILGANAELELQHLTYLDYIGTQTNGVPDVETPLDNLQPKIRDLIECGKISDVQSLIKARNPSAFFVDGNASDAMEPAVIKLFGSSAIYFRSGVDCNGDVVPSFTVDPNQTGCSGAGNIVFDVEAPLTVIGDVGPLGQPANSALNILSLQVTPTGCSVLVGSGETQFPQRTFARDASGDYLQYAKAAWLINNRMNLEGTSIVHTDANHAVFDRETLLREHVTSSPTYIGGESYKIFLPENQQRPTIALYQSTFHVQTNVALTGVDIRVPNDVDTANLSYLRFYNNGRRLDNGYGRIMILGTDEGSYSACGYPINGDAHLDVFQDTVQASSTPQVLLLDVGANTACITEGLTYDISGQYAVQTIFLGNASNISIGTDGSQGIDVNTGLPFNLVTTPTLSVAGDFYSFETQGGYWGLPETSSTTGQGGIFVDANGTIKIEQNRRANFDIMVTKSRNGAISLPKNQVYFSSRVGIAQWDINLTDTAQQVLIPAGIRLSDFTMDWGAITKDYVSSNSFVPYEPLGSPAACALPAVTDANLRALPKVRGTVDQFQIKRSRIGDQMHLQVQGGDIKELVFLVAGNSAEAPVGFLVVEDEAYVGIGTAHRNVDSLHASVKLGVNGLSICANGNATIGLNEDVLIDNTCAILSGTSFGVDGAQILTIYSQLEKEFRIKPTGVLDLSQFNNDNKILRFSGSVRLVCEPGARIILGGGTLVFTDMTQWTFESVLDSDLLAGSMPADLDDIRVKLSGRGFILMNEGASMQLLEDQFLGIETFPSCDLVTSITWILNGQASINIGTDIEPGGALQIGNTQCFADNAVDATFLIDGDAALMQVNRRGFLGFGVGVADKASPIPNDWLVNCLENVKLISVEVRTGTFRHNQISSGDVDLASLFAVGPCERYSWTFNVNNSRILGGGNFVLLQNCLTAACSGALDILNDPIFMNVKNMPVEAQKMIEQSQALVKQAEEMMNMARQMLQQQWRGPKDFEKVRSLIRESKSKKNEAITTLRNIIPPSINPIVQSTAGVISSSLSVGILSGLALLVDPSKVNLARITPQQLFTYLTTSAYATQSSSRANIARNQTAQTVLGFVDGSLIRRDSFGFILSSGGASYNELDHSLALGAISIGLDVNSRSIVTANEIKGKVDF